MKKVFLSSLFFLILLSFLLPFAVSAHEVYVLSPQEVKKAETTLSPNPFTVIPGKEKEFLLWGSLAVAAVLIVLTVSVSPLFEKVFDPLLMRLKKYAPVFGRLTLGASLFLSGSHQAFFGPELSISSLIPSPGAEIMSAVLMGVGAAVILGLFTRLMAFFGIVLFSFVSYHYHFYMLTYVNYLGEMLLFFILGGGLWSVDRLISMPFKIERYFFGVARFLEPYAFLILRILFGTAVFFASYYAKFLHSNLALDTVADYHLTQYFPFTPLFLVLGAFIVEALMGIAFAIGFEIRFAALFFSFFLTLSITFFGEAVWPHLILFGVCVTLFAHGYDKYTAEKIIFERIRDGEPVL